jgi:hypothetical protein
VVRKPEAESAWASDRLIAAGLLIRQGTRHTSYLFAQELVGLRPSCPSKQTFRSLRGRSAKGESRSCADD